MKLDFSAGYKTTAFAIVSVLSFTGHQVAEGEILEAVTAVGIAVSNIGMAYGLIMKLVRKIKGESKFEQQ